MREVEGRNLIMALGDRQEELVAETKVQGEARSDLPVVLTVERVGRAKIVDVVEVVDRTAVGQTDEK